MEAEQCTAASVAVQPPSPARSTRTARTPQSFGCRGACTQSISTWSKLKIPFKFRRMPYAVCRTLFETLQHLDHPSVVAAQHAGIMAGAALIHCLSLGCSAAERPPRQSCCHALCMSIGQLWVGAQIRRLRYRKEIVADAVRRYTSQTVSPAGWCPLSRRSRRRQHRHRRPRCRGPLPAPAPPA